MRRLRPWWTDCARRPSLTGDFEATAWIAFRMAFSTINDALGARPDPAATASALAGSARDEPPRAAL